jgi:hypothetical protein
VVDEGKGAPTGPLETRALEVGLVHKIIKGQFEVPESFGTEAFEVWRKVMAA